MKYKRILLKLSGEALMGKRQYGIDAMRLMAYAEDIKAAVDTGVQIAIVIGGGNIHRGVQGVSEGIGRVQGDYMGMLATVINSLALHGALQNVGMKCRLTGGLAIEPIVEETSGERVVEYLEAGYVVLISGGTGNPFFTTDSASALRAIEMKADAILKGTRVDGIYSADPEKYPEAIKYQTLTFAEAYEKQLKIMDLTAFTLCKENNMPILVFDMNTPGNLLKVLNDPAIGTIVDNG
ncbi:MAG: UMP kinase [Bacteroidales bacterium]|jgi:uridylate kinase|nr:UMP kinase [Bacteroidales bacterium]MDD3528190.1 UMP kinase [Bacteroidales bacterium]MDD4176606.1 UMP kinase [Bacteroidales bacterium]MDD4740286.1 UMP kinase [Bacteroidales bacterium]MDY0333915.1 UMP kinase [Bacteroidales bacterium]